MIHISIPSTRDPEGYGELFGMGIKHEGVQGEITVKSLMNTTEENIASLARCRHVAEWLAGKKFDKGLEIALFPKHLNVTGHSWELMVTLAMTSLLTGTGLQKEVVGTGRLDEGGRILAVGSYTEKVIAARDAGYRKLLVSRDILVEEKILDGLQIIPVSNIAQTWMVASEEPGTRLEQLLFDSLTM